MVKIWDDPQVNVDDLIVECLERYFGPAGEPMQPFYLRLESIACAPANCAPP